MSNSNSKIVYKPLSFLPGPCPLYFVEDGTHYCGLDIEEVKYVEVSEQGNPNMLQNFLKQLQVRTSSQEIICINRVYEDNEAYATCPTRQLRLIFFGKSVPAELHRQAWKLGATIGIFEDDEKCSECIRKVLRSLILQS
ncbi:MAG: hypothetical protein ACFFC7_30795 [Candidatus Hermodarchaeota archaeon]